MNKYGEVTLCRKVSERDSINQEIGTITEERTIQCEIEGIERGEWLTAQQGGYQAKIMAKVFTASYNGESLARYNGKMLCIYRTYEVGDKTELYLGERIGELNVI